MLTCAGAYIGARFGVAVMLNLIFALIFFQIGDARKEGYDTYSDFGAIMYGRYSHSHVDRYDMYSHFGAVLFAAISAMFGSAQPGARSLGRFCLALSLACARALSRSLSLSLSALRSQVRYL
jgi:hypothetical protein